MNLLHLHYFFVVAKEQGFTNASKVLRIQQPAISRMVGQLEESLGFKLFERVGRNIQLTAQGYEVFESCKRIFGEVEALQASLGQISGECRGPLQIAAAEVVASHLIPPVLASLLKDHPKIYPSIFSGPASMLFEQIESGQVELGLFFHIPDLPSKLEMSVVKAIRYRLVVRKDLKTHTKTLASFIGSREIDDVSTRRFPTLERLRQDHAKAAIMISSNNLTAHRQMVLEGLGVSILPEFLVREDIKAGRLADLYPKENFEFNLKMVKRKNGVLSLNAREFLKRVSS